MVIFAFSCLILVEFCSSSAASCFDCSFLQVSWVVWTTFVHSYFVFVLSLQV